MTHLTFLSLAMELVDKASDGKLTLEEVSECCWDAFPDFCEPIGEAVIKAVADGEVSVWEVFCIVTRVLGND